VYASSSFPTECLPDLVVGLGGLIGGFDRGFNGQ
jgi:hypothetical protein